MSYYLKKDWKACFGGCFFGILTWGMQALAALILIQCFKMAINLDFKRFAMWTGINVLAWAAYFGLGMLQGYFEAKAIRVLNNHVRRDILQTLLSKDYISYHSEDSGEYFSYLTNNVREIENRAWRPFFNAVGCIAEVIWSLIALAFIHWSLLIVGVVCAIIMLRFPKLFEKKMQTLGEQYAQAQAVGAGKLRDLLAGIDIIRFFNRKDRFMKQGDEAGDHIEKHGYRMSYIQNNIGGVIGFVNVAGQFATDIVIVFFAIKGLIDVSVIAGGGNLTGGVSRGFQGLADCKIAFAGAKPFFEQIKARSDMNKLPDHREGLPALHDRIVMDQISYYYGEQKVLDHFSACFVRGGKYAITGASGSGKSTLLKILMGWLPDYSGKVLYDQCDLKSYSPEQIQAKLGYIEQDVFLFNTTILDNITLGEKFSESEIEKAIQDSALAGDIENLPMGIQTPVGEGGCKLSGGQKQRIAIARALIHDRSILLVDEGTSALDQKNADIVESKLLANAGLTLILVSHHLSDQRKAQFDRVYALEK